MPLQNRLLSKRVKSLLSRLQKCNYFVKSELPHYTKAQLALRNGQDKPMIWVAYKGLIYDVTPSRLWRNGKHYEHWAGQDLTEELEDAPHNANVFDKFEAIGILD
jgi:predicted heme/steroid binding protein